MKDIWELQLGLTGKSTFIWKNGSLYSEAIAIRLLLDIDNPLLMEFDHYEEDNGNLLIMPDGSPSIVTDIVEITRIVRQSPARRDRHA